mmetsp:Transcript_32309/g.111222  ORF Transcript_32309/g.111222 Transcript_32309/m.111222 type:complete len:1482 (-) Transcript_32309:100-4545(-)
MVPRMLHGALRFLERWHAALILGQAVLVAIVALTRKGDSKRVGTFDKARLTLAMAAVACDAVVFADGDARWSEVLFNMGALVLVTCTAVAEARKGRKEDGVMRLVYVQIGAGAAYAAFKKVHEDAFPLACARAAATIAAALLYALFNAGARSTRAKRTATSGDYVALEEAEELEDEESPEDAAGPLSCAAFYWLSPLLATGYRRPLLSADLFPLVRNDKPSVVHAQALEGWEKRASLKIKSGKRLLRALTGAFGGHYLVGSLFKLGYDTTQLLVPLLLSAFLVALGDGDDKKAYMVSAGIVFNAALSTALLHQYFQRTYRTGMRLKSAAVSLVYSKALVVAREASWEDGVAVQTTSITNLMSVDAQRLQDNMTYLMSVVSGIYQIVVCLYLLDRELGVSAFGGFAVMLVFMPVTQRIVLLSRSQQKVVLTNKDARIKLQAEALGGIKIVKLYGWEGALSGELKRLRGLELAALWQYKLVSVLSRVVFNVVPTAVSLVTFSMYVLLGHDLSVPKVYTSLALFNVLRFPLMMVPTAVSSAVEGMLSVDRIAAFLVEPEVQQHRDGVQNPMSRESSKDAVFSTDASVSWVLSDSGADRQCFLRHVSFNAKRGDLVAIVGETGSGKSGLFACLLGEASVVAGAVGVVGSVAYAAQTPWIQNATLRENVLFGAPYDDEKYRDTIFRCALEPDLEQLADGDATAIGEKGLNLSGGQKQRVALARAFYADADVYLLDDPLSAVDAHVGEHLLRECVAGRLAGKTRLLCTHQLQALAFADSVVVMDGGRVACQGSRADVAQQLRSTPLGREAARDDVAAPRDDDDLASQIINALSDERRAAALKRKAPEPRLASGSSNDLAGLGAALPQQLVQEEHRQDAAPGLASYLLYVRAAGGVSLFGLIIALHVSVSLVQLYQSRCLASWVKALDTSASVGPELYKYLGATAGYVGVLFVALLLRYVAAQKGARALHGRMFEAVLRAPVRFFDTNLLGRIINRFSSDMNDIDRQVMTTLMSFFWAGSALVPLFVVLATAAPALLIPLTVVCLGYVRVAIIFLAAARDLKRIDSTSKSPLYAHFSETLNGLAVVRGFRASERFSRHSADLVDAANRANFYLGATSRWLGIRLNAAGAAVAGGTALYLALTRAHSAAVTGLVLNYALSFQYAVIGLIQSEAQMEQSMVAVERVTEYVCLEPEAYAGPKAAPPGWPHSGAIELRNVKLRYAAPESGLGAAAVSAGAWVVDGVSLDVAAGERVGVVGRTGSGKSTLLLGLMRVLDKPRGCCEGSVRVDGVDVHALPLSELRARVAMVQQDPVLFRGTVRSNLDPFGKHSDADCTRAVGRVRCFAYDAGDAAHVLALDVSEGGANFSVGQRQLLCLARALLVGSRVLLLDEATANIDLETDHKIQAVIRDELDGVTVVTIAHRLRTVVDYHKVLVLGGGKVLEHDTPAKLLRNAASHFSKMCAKTGSLDELVRDSLDAERRFALDAKKNQ